MWQSLYTIHSVILLDAEGERIASKFYEGPQGLKEQKEFEVSAWRVEYLSAGFGLVHRCAAGTGRGHREARLS